MKTLQQAGQTVRCLILDDDRIDAEAMKRLIKKAHLNNPVAHAADAHHALKTLHAWEQEGAYPPILLFLSTRVPRISSTELMRRFTREPFAAQLSVLMVSQEASTTQADLGQYNILGTINKKDLSNSFRNALSALNQQFDLTAA